MSYLERFYKQISERTLENKNAFKILFDQQLYGVCIGLLRQELDTLIRLVYINELEDCNIKNEILKKSVEQGLWGLNKRISDSEMIKIAEEIKGWPKLVYDFGNRFIHLSGFHLYKLEEPILKIESRELELIIKYLEEKHGFHNYEKLTFQHLLDYLPHVMQKIIENNLEELEILKITL